MVKRISGSGSIIEGSPGDDIFRAIDIAHVVKLFCDTGFVLFRRFSMDDDKFTELTNLFSNNFRTHGATRRSQVGQDEYLIVADPGNGEIHLHSELSYLPDPPDVLWFCCVTPPAHDGQTTICDGTKLWSMFGHDARRWFLSNKVRYSTIYSPSMWQRYFDVANLVELQAKLSNSDSTAYSVGPGERLLLNHLASAVRPCKYGAADTFSNSVLHWCLDGMYDSVSFEDGKPIPRPLIQEIQRMADAATELIEWETGDVAMIDNTRMMHGRRSFDASQRRKLHVRMGQSLAPRPTAA